MQTLLPPSIRQPLVECGPFVVVDGTFPGATIECQVAGTTVHQAAVSDVTPVWLDQITLVPNAVVRVRQRLDGGDWSNWSSSTRVQPAVKSGPPVVLADHVLRGASTLRVVGLVPGSSVTVRAAPNGSLVGSAFAFPDGTAGVHLSNWVPKASKLVIDVSTCSEEGVKSEVPVSAPPRALPAPLIDGAVRCATRITVSGMIAGAILKIALSDGEMTHFPTEPRKRYRLPRPLVAGEQLSCWMEWSNGLKGAKTQVAVAKVLGAAHTITLEQPLFAGATQLKLGQWEFDELILVNAFGGLASSTPTETLGVGLPSPDGVLSLPRPLVAGEFIELSSSVCLRRGISERFEVKPKPAKIASPRIAEPVLDGAFAVFVFGCEPDSTVVVSVDGAIVGSSTAGNDGYATVPVSPSLGVGSRVAAQCQFGNLSSLPGPRVRVRPLARLATPVIPAATYDTETSLLIVGVAPGAWLTVWDAEGRPFREVRAAETAVRISVPPLGLTAISCSASLGAFRAKSANTHTISDFDLNEKSSKVCVGVFKLQKPVSIPLPDSVFFEEGDGGYDYTLGPSGFLQEDYTWKFFVEGRYYTIPDGGGQAKPVCVIIHGDDGGSDVVYSLNPMYVYQEDGSFVPSGNLVHDVLESLGLSELEELGRIADATHAGIATACFGYDNIGVRLARLGCAVISLNMTGATTSGLASIKGFSSNPNCLDTFGAMLGAALRALKQQGFWTAGIPGTIPDFERTVLIGHSCGGMAAAALTFESLAQEGITCVGVVGLEPVLRAEGNQTKEVPCDVLTLSSLNLFRNGSTERCTGQIVGGPTSTTTVVQLRSGDHFSFSDYYSYLGNTKKNWAGDTELDFQLKTSRLIGVFVASVAGLSPVRVFDSHASLPPSCRDGIAAVWVQPPLAVSLSHGAIDSETMPDSEAKPADLTSAGASFAVETRFNFCEGPDQCISIVFSESSARLVFSSTPAELNTPGAIFVSTGGMYSHACLRSTVQLMLEVASSGKVSHFRVQLSDFNRVSESGFDGGSFSDTPKRIFFSSTVIRAAEFEAISEALGLVGADESAHISLLFRRSEDSCSKIELGPIIRTLAVE